jgi:hypothetical protein
VQILKQSCFLFFLLLVLGGVLHAYSPEQDDADENIAGALRPRHVFQGAVPRHLREALPPLPALEMERLQNTHLLGGHPPLAERLLPDAQENPQPNFGPAPEEEAAQQRENPRRKVEQRGLMGLR